jgi:DNA invertase Pin-like site-specific DNA recombinase
MMWGYARVSTEGQNVGRQLLKMRSLGIPDGAVLVDRASGRDLDRPAWRELMARLRPGDELVLDSLDRLGRDYGDVTREWRRLVGMGVDIRCLDLDFFDSARFREMGALGVCVEDMLLSLLAYVAQTERDKMRARQAEGIAVARAAGRYRGRAPKEYDPQVLERAGRALAEGGRAAAARVLGCHPNTVSNMVADGRLHALPA